MTTSNALPSHELIDVRVNAVHVLATDIKLFELQRPDGQPLPAVEAGAHIGVRLPNGIIRQYSLLSPDSNPLSYSIGVKKDPQSTGGSLYMHDQLREGDIIQIEMPRNNFPLVEAASSSVLFAGGIGITPIWCMVQRLDALQQPWHLYYACRTRGDAAFLSELEPRENVTLHFDDEHGGEVLDIAAIVNSASSDTHLYCCGPAPMLAAFENATSTWPSDHVHIEYFTAKEESATSGGFVVELARSKVEVFVPEGKSILYALREAGIDVPSSCEEGVCGSCEMRVLSGIPDHRDAILSEPERAANNTMMICCSGCKSDRLVLDY